jgi:adenylate cyclase
VFASMRGKIEVGPVRELTLKGFHKPVPAFELVSWRESCDEPMRGSW